jgi:serine/threonine protein kinase
MAPEILERWPAYDTKCDLWSVGVILFLLLGGYLPFEDQDEDKVFERTRNGQYFFHPSYWKLISKSAKNLVTKLLTVNPNKRFSANEALTHEWMTTCSVPSGSGSAGNDKSRAVDEEPALANIDTLKTNVIKAKKANNGNKAAPNPDRIKDLNENFGRFLERQRSESKVTRITPDGFKNRNVAKFVEEGSSGKKFLDVYELGDVLGEGGYACVYRGTHKKTKQLYAVKDVNTDVLEENSLMALKEEITVLKLLRGGPHIIRLFDVFEEPNNGHTYLIMEEMKGGDLLTRITEKEVYTEREARKTCKIIFQAMDYLHKMKICHRCVVFLRTEGVCEDAQLLHVDLRNIYLSLFGTTRDIKPENVSLPGNCRVSFCDLQYVSNFAHIAHLV